jgi:GTPase KRas protein
MYFGDTGYGGTRRVHGVYTRLYRLRDQWIRDGEGFVLVYSIVSRSTFERVDRFKEQIARVKDTAFSPLVLVGNKCDRLAEREVSADEGRALAKQLGCEFVEASAKINTNVEKVFYTVQEFKQGCPCH